MDIKDLNKPQLILLATPLSPPASAGLDPRIPGGQAAFEARVEIRKRSS